MFKQERKNKCLSQKHNIILDAAVEVAAWETRIRRRRDESCYSGSLFIFLVGTTSSAFSPSLK
jgi:hypothetical protein